MTTPIVTQAEVAEAMELLKGEPSLEIESPRVVTERRDGQLVEADRPAFVKIYTSFKNELKDIEGTDLKVWLYLALSINRHTKDARPGLRKIAADVGISVNTVRLSLSRLADRGLLDIAKDDGKNNTYRPADYASVSKFDTVENLTVSNSEGTVSKNQRTVSTQYRKSAQLEELEELENTAAAEKLSYISELYEANIGIIYNTNLADELTEYSAFPRDWLTRAFREAADANVRKWSYVRSCLDSWKRAGMITGKKNGTYSPAPLVQKSRPMPDFDADGRVITP